MYIEKRKVGSSIKYYLVHSYREEGTVRKIRKYLGLNLSKAGIKNAKGAISSIIRKEIDELNTEIFNFTLTKNQVEKLNRFEDLIKVNHLQGFDWTRFTEEFTYHTNAIEGSTVSLEEVPKILHKSKVTDSEEIETKGVANTVGFIRKTKEKFSLGLMLKLHKLCFEGSRHFAGKFRDLEVVIRNGRGDVIHRGVPAKELQDYLEELVQWYGANRANFKPLVLAAIIHNQFEDIHPFQDGNGRVGRLLLNFILLQNNHPPINLSLEDRQEYYASLQEYHKKNDLKPTLRFLIKQYKKTLK